MVALRGVEVRKLLGQIDWDHEHSRPAEQVLEQEMQERASTREPGARAGNAYWVK